MPYTINTKLSHADRLVLSPQSSIASTIISILAFAASVLGFALAVIAYRVDQVWLIKGGALLGTFFGLFGVLFSQRGSRSVLIVEGGRVTVEDRRRGEAVSAAIAVSDADRLEVRQESRHVSSGTTGRSSYTVYVVYLVRSNGSEWNLYESKIASESEDIRTRVQLQLRSANTSPAQARSTSSLFHVSATDASTSITWRRQNGKLYKQLTIGIVFLAMFNGAYLTIFSHSIDSSILRYGFPGVSILILVAIGYAVIKNAGAERCLEISPEGLEYASRSALGFTESFRCSIESVRAVRFVLDTDALSILCDAENGTRGSTERALDDGLRNAEYLQLEQAIEEGLSRAGLRRQAWRPSYNIGRQPFFVNPSTNS